MSDSVEHLVNSKDLDAAMQDNQEIDVTQNMPNAGYMIVERSEEHLKFYPESYQFQIRPANTAEIRAWSTLDETTNPASVYSYLNEIVKQCTHIKGANVNDIKEADRLFLVSKIHELTFVEAERPAIINHTCSNQNCKHKWHSKFTSNLFKFNMPDAKYDKYFDKETGQYIIETRSFGTIVINQATVAVGAAVLAYLQGKDAKWFQDNKNFLQVAQLLVPHGTTVTSKLFDKMYLDFCSWDAKKLAFMLELAKGVTYNIDTKVHSTCPKCKSSTATEFDVDGGMRHLLLPVSNIDDELL